MVVVEELELELLPELKLELLPGLELKLLPELGLEVFPELELEVFPELELLFPLLLLPPPPFRRERPRRESRGVMNGTNMASSGKPGRRWESGRGRNTERLKESLSYEGVAMA